MTTRIQAVDFSVDLLQAILWQYNDAARLQSLLVQKQAWYDEAQTTFWTDWTRDVFNLLTANDFGLSVWGVILGIPISIGLPGTGARPVWGFGIHNQNFEHGNFGRDSAGVAGLTIEQKRTILRLRYFQLISDGTAPHTNFILREVFGGGYVLDPEDMTCTYVFPVAIPANVLTVIQDLDLLPRPAGVDINILVDPGLVFGFDPYYQNFENGGFGA